MLMMVACEDPTRGTQFQSGHIVFEAAPFHIYLVDGSALHCAPKPISKEGPRHLVRYVLNGPVPELLQELEDRCKSGSNGCPPQNLSLLFVGQVPLQLSFEF